MYASEICAEGIFVTFPCWLKNMKSRSKIALFSNERHFDIWFPKKKPVTFFWSKLSKLHKKTQFCMGHYIFPKTRWNKNKPWTHSTPLKEVPTFANPQARLPQKGHLIHQIQKHEICLLIVDKLNSLLSLKSSGA